MCMSSDNLCQISCIKRFQHHLEKVQHHTITLDDAGMLWITKYAKIWRAKQRKEGLMSLVKVSSNPKGLEILTPDVHVTGAMHALMTTKLSITIHMENVEVRTAKLETELMNIKESVAA